MELVIVLIENLASATMQTMLVTLEMISVTL